MRILRGLRRRLDFVKRLEERLERLERSQLNMKRAQREILRCKAMLRELTGQPIHVVFFCHSPSLWGKLRPVHAALAADTDFVVSIVTVPYRHGAWGDGEYRDEGMADHLRAEEGIEPIAGYDEASGEWIDLQELAPDYVFFQTPYDSQFPEHLRSECVSSFARVCYVPYYGLLLFEGEVEAVTHRPEFFRNVSLSFFADEKERRDVLKRCAGELAEEQVIVTGSPMLDYTLGSVDPRGTAWNLERRPGVRRILWTPRWRTSEGNCHFFDYKDYFLEFARSRSEIDFLFRPHPLSLSTLLQTGEFPREEQDAMLAAYDELPNAGIDRSGNYQDVFLSSDILVSDMSSMMAEYLVTGKPVVYTHRVNSFNEIGAELAQGFYWVRNQEELEETLEMLLRGEDPLEEKRRELVARMFCIPEQGAAHLIKCTLKKRAEIEMPGRAIES